MLTTASTTTPPSSPAPAATTETAQDGTEAAPPSAAATTQPAHWPGRDDLARAISRRIDAGDLPAQTVERYLGPAPDAVEERCTAIRRLWRLEEPDAGSEIDRVWWEEAEALVRARLAALAGDATGSLHGPADFARCTSTGGRDLLALMFGDRSEVLRAALERHCGRDAAR